MGNYTTLFYWLVVADNAKLFFGWFAVLGLIVGILCIFGFFISFDKDGGIDKNINRKWNMWIWPIAILFLSLWIFTPSKKDALLIVAGGQTLNFLTNDSTAKQIPHEMSSFILTELKNMGEEAKVNLNLNEQKDKILDEAKKMSAQELMEKMKVDTTFAKVVLNKK